MPAAVLMHNDFLHHTVCMVLTVLCIYINLMYFMLSPPDSVGEYIVFSSCTSVRHVRPGRSCCHSVL